MRPRDLAAPFLLALGFVATLPAAGPVHEPTERNLYEWSAVAPIVAAVEPIEEDGRWIRLRVVRVIRGDLGEGSVVRADRRTANRERGSQALPLKLDPDLSYVVLLDRSPRGEPGDPPSYDFVRGVRGARELPPEGADAVLDALAEFVAVQDLKDFGRTWRRYRELLQGVNPIVLETVLDQHLKFRRGDRDLLGILEPLLDHPRTGVREKTAALFEVVLEQAEDPEAPEFAPVRTRLLAKARRDPEVAVRVAATAALGRFPGEDTAAVLREIAETDPDQEVRYEAERILYERVPGSDRARRD